MSAQRKRMLIFDDDEDFAMAIREQPWVKRTFDAHIEQDWRNIDNNFRLNDSWDIILTDVAVPNTTGWGGHEMIKNTVDQRRLNTPIIVMSGDADVELKKLEKLPGNTPMVFQTPVKLGQLQNNLYPVISGLKAGDKVAVSNTSRLRSGMPVKVSVGAN